MGTSATGNFATKRLQILNGHDLNICRNKTFEKKAKNRMKTADNGDKCNRKLCNKPHKNIEQTRLNIFRKQNFRKKAKNRMKTAHKADT